MEVPAAEAGGAWPSHPPPTLDEALWSCDFGSVNQKLDEKAPSLFSSDVNELELWAAAVVSEPADGNTRDVVEKQRFSGSDPSLSLESSASQLRQGNDLFYIISQARSWDHLLITKEVFSKLMKRENVFPYFLETVFAFGVRTKDDDNTWPNFHYRMPNSGGKDSVDIFGGYADTAGLAVETCYTVRFFERNHRKTGDPWSLRQTGVYQRSDAATNISVWALIKPSIYLKDRLQDKLHTLAKHPQLRNIRHMLLHLVIVASTLEGWPEYITTQQDTLERFENKSFFSDADHDTQNDFKLSFEDSQTLQHLRRKLIKAAAVLEGGNNLCNRLLEVVSTMVIPIPTSVGGFKPLLIKHIRETLVAELKDMASNLSCHKQRVADLQQRSSNATNLLLSIVEHRVGNSSLRSARANEASQEANSRSLEVMKTIAVNAELEHGLEQKISINIRALTFVATMYLPASLLAGIFSSQLVRYEANNFSASPKFWEFIVVLIPMVVITFAVVYILQGIWTKRLKAKTARLTDRAMENG